ncbi:MAG: hypothetical protein HKN25_09760 [Pyrinomonadaceae bacterium]|nr:hypothetical protein [Pyrinomonadaceae bacterium]
MNKEIKDNTQESSQEENNKSQTPQQPWIAPELKILPVPAKTEGGTYVTMMVGDDAWYKS